MKWHASNDSEGKDVINSDSDEGSDMEDNEEMVAFLENIDPSVILTNHKGDAGPRPGLQNHMFQV